MKRFWEIAVIFFLLLPAVRPLLPGTGYFPMHDDTQVGRVQVMAEAMKNGQFPVRWVDSLGYGYGYPLFNFYAPLPYYFGGALTAVGINAVTSTKIMFLIGFSLAFFSLYFLLRFRLGKTLAFLSATLYAYAPYHAVQIYVRGAVGELWAYGLLPLLFFAVPHFRGKVREPGFPDIILPGLGLAAVILSHTIYGYLACGLIFILVVASGLISLKNRKAKPYFVSLIKVAVIGLSLSAFFWLPALTEKQYTRVEGMLWDRTRYADHFVCLPQLWNSLWGYGGSAPGCLDGMSFMAGKLHLVLISFSAGLFFFKRRPKSHFTGLTIALFWALALTVFFLTAISEKIWNLVPYAQYVQYPWRLLPVLALITSLLPAVALSLLQNRLVLRVTVAGFIFAVLVYYPKFFRPQSVYFDTGRLTQKSDILFRVSKISDEYLPPDFQPPAVLDSVAGQAIETAPGDQLDYTVVRETYVKAEVKTSKPESSFRFLRVFFPGWKYLVNGKGAEFTVKGAVPEIKIPAGTNIVEMIFEDTPVRRISNIISLLAAAGLLYIYGKKTDG